MPEGRMGILVGGGPAPGINSALSAATIGAINRGLEVVGILDGFSHLITGRTDMTRALTLGDVSRIHDKGGSIIRTSRANPTKTPEDLRRTVETLRQLGINRLVSIGGEDTGSAAAAVSHESAGEVRVAHIPKTIDNDLPLPANAPTFGFETARHVGTQFALNLMEEAKTTNRWCMMVVMGRKAGHLALAIGKSAGATVTVIPEEFSPDKITVHDVCKVIEGAILKRRAYGRDYGLAVVAEGVASRMDPEHLSSLPGVEVGYDAHGHIRLEKIPLAAILERQLISQFGERDETLPFVSISLGYELRCADPIPFDVDYTRTLGSGADKFLFDETSRPSGIVCLDNGKLRVLPFEDLQEPDTGRIRTRLVDIASDHYAVARQYMIRLNRADLDDEALVTRMAAAGKMNEDAFRERFAPIFNVEVAGASA
jgi:6-phosphofructokinase